MLQRRGNQGLGLPMKSRAKWLQEKKSEAQQLGDLATKDIVPSRSDFSQFIGSQRTDLALVPRLKRADPFTGSDWPDADLVALARLFDDTDVGALAVCTSNLHRGAADDINAIRAAASAPLLRDDLCLDDAQVYDARLRGADAVRIPLAELEPTAVSRLSDIALSLHMTAVFDAACAADLDRAPMQAPNVIGLNCSGADGFVDIEAVARLADEAPRHLVVVVLAEIRSFEDADALRGVVDGLVVGDLLLAAANPLEVVERILQP